MQIFLSFLLYLSTSLLLLSYQITSAMSATMKKSGALIFMHGLGDTPAGWSHIAGQLPHLRPALSNLHYVFPRAPTIPIAINGNATMPGWFDIYDWPISVGVADDSTGLLRSVQQVEDEIVKIENEQGIPRNKIVVGGFSQGGAVALLTAYHRSNQAKPLAGCVCLSGWLTLKDDVLAPSASVPLFWGHGQADDKVLFEQQSHGVMTLKEKEVITDASSTVQSYPGLGHGSNSEELKSMAEFLEKTLLSPDDKEL